MYTLVTIAVDAFGGSGELVSSIVGARATETPDRPHDVLDAVLGALPATYVQLTYDEVARALAAQKRARPTVEWDQLSIF